MSHGDERPSRVAPRGSPDAGHGAEPELTWFGALRDPGRERELRASRFENELRRTLRISAWAAALIYLLFGALDALVVPDVLSLAWTLRYGVAAPVAIALAILASTRYAERALIPIGVLHSLLGPALFLTVGELAADPGGLLYTLWGAVLFPLLVPQLTRLGVVPSLVVGALVLGYLILLDALVTPRPLEERVFVVLFFVVGCGFGAWATYQAEVAARRSFHKEKIIEWQLDELARERETSERLLLNVLPASIAARLRSNDGTIADRFDEVTVLFADLAGFTRYTTRVAPEALVAQLDTIFSRFDAIADELGLEKIKTIGDAYMVAAGLPEPHPDGPGAMAQMALRMLDALAELAPEAGERLSLRVGIHTGPAIAGVIGRRKFIYDLWGDTVNTASRMESHGEPGRIQVSEATASRLRDRYALEPRGPIELRGRGRVEAFWLMGAKPAP
ncbi:MAG: adenylate/guanylate cyclase domain-containing protein [Sandaracinaceae bacterium]|nr:adenylate/guanylate cyclase domain-containing protein [Sandaracinaceae bacterium]